MRAHRLQRLRLLTQGVALLGLGASEAGCHDPPDSVHINAPFIEPDAGAPSPSAVVVQPAHLNAPYTPPDAGSSPAPSGSAADPTKPVLQIASGGAPAATPSTKPPALVPHMNATATPPKTVNGPPRD